MPRQSLVWTALPAGSTPDGTGLRISVHLAPRLDPLAAPALLSSFAPDWVDWPATLAAAQFTVSFGAQSVNIGASAAAGLNRIDTTIGAADSSVWKALFKPALPVNGFRFEDLSTAQLASFDANVIANVIEQLYGGLAAGAGDDLPTVSEFVDNEAWRGLIEAVARLDAASVDRRTGLRDPVLQARLATDAPATRSGGAAMELARFQFFHTPAAPAAPRDEVRRDDARIRARWQEPRRASIPDRNELAKTLDFHRIVAAMGSYPTLLRRLGLVVDLVVDRSQFAVSPDAPLSVAVTFPAGHFAIPHTHDAGPRVRTLLTATRFQPVDRASEDAHIVDGLLVLDPSRHRLLQFDVDGAGLKLLNFARTLGRRMAPRARVDAVSRHADRTGAPALRGGGFALVERARAGALAQRLKENVKRNAALQAHFAGGGAALDLHWQDVLRGWRIDIWDATTGQWLSLCRRHARYSLGGGAVVVAPEEEEATVRMAATLPAERGASPETLRLHEIAVAWTGWSLAAPPPGRAIDPSDGIDRSSTQSAAEVPPGIDLSSEFRAVPGSLPRLRYGRAYWLRARAVDLAGNSLPPQPDDFGPEQPLVHAQPFLRFEPLLPPVLALLSRGGAVEAPLEGEAMERIVIRSYNDTPAGNAIATTEVAWRAAIPPRVSVREAEQHGMLDVAGRVDAAAFNQLAFAKDIDPTSPLAVVREIDIAVPTPFAPVPIRQSFAVHEWGRALTYLPDPLSREAVASLIDHPDIGADEIIDIPLYPDGAWPEAQPFAIAVYDGPGERPHFDTATRTLRIALPKGVRARLRLSMKLDAASLDLMGVFAWMSDAQRATQRPRALAGRHWMLTPWQTLELVHAVQRPLTAPSIESIVIQRRFGDTAALPVVTAKVSVKSTDRLDLLAEWHEPATGNAREPRDVERNDCAFHVKVTAAEDYASRMVEPQAGGYPDHTLIADDVICINAVSHQVSAKKAHEFNDTRYRRISYRFDATTRFRDQLPHLLITREAKGERVSDDASIKIGGDAQVTWVPNAAPPPMPQVLYVVPTFGWSRRRDPDGLHSIRRAGGGLRVYLDGPWHASGYGEMLAVVLPPAEFAGDPDQEPRAKAYKTYVTQWGNDPAWDSAFVRGLAPRRADFARARIAPDPEGRWLPPGAPLQERDQRPGPFRVTALVPPGIRGLGAVEIAPHDVSWDTERGLWFADIEIAPGSAYFPFVRLALARYQPISVDGAHLSSVVLADFAALAPDRWLNVSTAADGRARRVSVFGVGYDDSSGHIESSHAPSMSVIRPLGAGVETLTPAPVAPRSVIELWIERLDERFGEDFGWRRIPATVTRLDPQPQASSLPVSSASSAVATVTSARARVREALASGQAGLVVRPDFMDAVRIWQTLWDGEIELPTTEGRLRLVIAEFEEYLVDDSAPFDRVPTRKDRRMVFVEHIPLV